VTVDKTVEEMVKRGELTPPSNAGGTMALLAFTPVEGDNNVDSAEIISQLREERL